MTDKRITAIYAQKRNPNRVNVDLDGEFAFGLSRIVAAWLKVGDLLSDQKIKSLQANDSEEVAYQKSLSLLGYKQRTEKEIRQKLIEKGFEEEVITLVIARLKEANLIQDREFAKMWVENRNDSHPRSTRLIRYELRNKGISDLIIDSALADSVDENELATRAGKNYARRLVDLDWIEFNTKLSAHLARRGFSYGVISPVVKSVWNSLESERNHTLDEKDTNYGKPA